MSLDGRRYFDGSKTPGNQNSPASHKNFKAQDSSSNLHGDGLSPSSQSHGSEKNHDYEGEHSPIKKSIFTKVKEKAKKLRHSLSNKSHRHHENESSATPPWDVSLEYTDDHEEPEHLGAPMYSSEMAPEKLNEAAKEQPQEVHLPSEKHVVASTVKNEVNKEEFRTPNKTTNNIPSQKMEPTSAPVHEATDSTAADIAGLTINTNAVEDPKDSDDTSAINSDASDAGKLGQGQGTSQHTWDKGVSVKEYLMQKLEPGEDEKALSQVITETMSPRKSSGEMGMVEKMKEAVNSFLQSDNAESISITKTTNDPNSANTDKNISTTTIKTIPSSPFDPVYTIEAKSSTPIPISTVAERNSSSGTKATSRTVNTNSSANDSSSAAGLNPSEYVPPINTNHNRVNDGKEHGRRPTAN